MSVGLIVLHCNILKLLVNLIQQFDIFFFQVQLSLSKIQYVQNTLVNQYKTKKIMRINSFSVLTKHFLYTYGMFHDFENLINTLALNKEKSFLFEKIF